MIEALQFEFMRHALLAGLLASIACGIIGTLVVVNRIVFISGELPMPLTVELGWPSFWGFPPCLAQRVFRWWFRPSWQWSL